MRTSFYEDQNNASCLAAPIDLDILWKEGKEAGEKLHKPCSVSDSADENERRKRALVKSVVDLGKREENTYPDSTATGS